MPLEHVPEETSLILNGRVEFADGTEPVPFGETPSGSRALKLFEFPKTDITLKLGKYTVIEKAVVDQFRRMGTLINVSPDVMELDQVEYIVIETPGYRTVKLEGIPIRNNRIAMPDVLIEREE